MASTDERIGPTAHYTAYVWYRCGFPYAEHFKTRRGAVLYWALKASGGWVSDVTQRPTLPDWLLARHSTIDRAVAACEPDLVIEVASGMSRRGTTFAADRGVRYVELDLPHMIRAKRARLDQLPSSVRSRFEGRLELAEIDALADDFPERLAAIAKDAERPVVITEGLLPYFDTANKLRIMGGIRAGLAKAGGGTYVTDMRTQARMNEVGFASVAVRAGARIVMGGRGQATDLRDDDEVRATFADAGFADASIADALREFPERSLMGAIWCASVQRLQR